MTFEGKVKPPASGICMEFFVFNNFCWILLEGYIGTQAHILANH
jgi:hypothetical protein